MKLNHDMSYDERREAIKAYSQNTSTDPVPLLGRLFYAARNGAISHVLRQLETFFRDKGFIVKANWRETSMGATTINLVMLDKKGQEHTRHIYLKRDVVVHPGFTETHSPVMYAFEKVVAGEYYNRRKPAVAIAFDDVLEDAGFSEMAAKLVLGTNYPFAYESYSSY